MECFDANQRGDAMNKKPQIDPDDIDALVKRIFALRPDSRERVSAELGRLVAKGPKRAKKK
jgi:hypothetical protein